MILITLTSNAINSGAQRLQAILGEIYSGIGLAPSWKMQLSALPQVAPSCPKLEDAVRHQVRRALNIPGGLNYLWVARNQKPPDLRIETRFCNEIGSSDFWVKHP